MDLGLNINASGETILQNGTKIDFNDKNIRPTSNDNRFTSYSEGTQSKIDPKSLDDRKTETKEKADENQGKDETNDLKLLEDREKSIQSEAKEMRETASKRSKTILAVGLVAGAIAGIVGGAMALAGIATMIPFIIAGISVFVGIFGSIASLPEKEQRYEVRLTVEYAKEALAGKAEEKAEALRYLSKIIEDTAKSENGSLYSDDRNNLLRFAVQTFLVENKKEIYDCLINGNEDVKSSAIILLTKAKIENLSENEKRIQGLLNGKELTDVQSHDLLIIKTMLYSKDSNVSKTGINVLTNTINKSKNTAKKLFADGILNQGTVKKMIHNESTKDEMLDLLKLMSKDKDLKNVVVDLVGSDIIDKLTKLDPKSTIEEKNKIIEEIKNLKLGIPEKLNAGDIVYKEGHDFGKILTVLEQSEENIQKANKIKETFQKPETVNMLKNRFSKNNGMYLPDGEIQESFLRDKNLNSNEKTYEFDKEKVAKSSIKDVNRNLFSIKGNNSKYIIKSQDKVGEELEKLLEKKSIKEDEKKSIKEDEFTKIIKNDMKVDINTLCSFPGQSVQGNVSFLLLKSGSFAKNTFFFAENILSTYSVSIDGDGTINLTVRDVLKVECPQDLGRSTLPVAIEEKMVFRLKKQNEGEYVPITPLEAQVNVYDADVFVEDNEDDGYKEPLALRIGKKVTSINWKNDEVKNNK